jgi:hypothetical protein
MGMRILNGRDFAATDRSNSPRVVIISQTMARALFREENAVGRRLAYPDETPQVWMEIVAVVEDVRFLNPGNAFAPFQIYIPHSQATWSYVTLCVRAAVPPATLIDPVRRAVAEIDPDMAVKELMPVPTYIRRGMQSIEAIGHLLVGFALLGLFLAALGIYGVIARLVAQRTNEIGIRMALGAQVGQIARLILGAGMRMALLGTALGLLGAVGLSRFLANAMPGMSGNSVAAIVAAAVVLVAVALLACWLPARRATRINPLDALRAE